MQKSYLLNPENSKTILILSQPKMCQKYTFLLTRAHFLGATGAPTEPVHESLLKTPILSRPNEEEYYGNGEEYENFQPGVFHPQRADLSQFEEFRDGDIEYDYEYSDNCTTYYDGWWAIIAGWGATYKFDGSCILRHAR